MILWHCYLQLRSDSLTSKGNTTNWTRTQDHGLGKHELCHCATCPYNLVAITEKQTIQLSFDVAEMMINDF